MSSLQGERWYRYGLHVCMAPGVGMAGRESAVEQAQAACADAGVDPAEAAPRLRGHARCTDSQQSCNDCSRNG